MSHLPYQIDTASKPDPYFNRVATYLKAKETTRIDEEFFYQISPSNGPSFKSRTDIRDSEMGLSGSVYLRMDEYHQKGWLGRYIEDGEVVYYIQGQDGDLSHLSAKAQVNVRHGLKQFDKDFRACCLKHPKLSEGSSGAKDFEFLVMNFGDQYKRTLSSLSHYVECSAIDLHNRFHSFVRQSPILRIDPNERMFSQWLAGHILAAIPDFNALIHATWKEMGFQEDIPRSALDTQYDVLCNMLTEAGWTETPEARRFGAKASWSKPLYGIDGKSRQNATIHFDIIGTCLQVSGYAVWGTQLNVLESVNCAIMANTSLDAPCGFMAQLNITERRLSETPWAPNPNNQQDPKANLEAVSNATNTNKFR